MTEAARLISKVLVLESQSDCAAHIKVFCEDNQLVGLTARPDDVMAVLRSNVDLGAVFIAEHHGEHTQGGILLARLIHGIRPELPIFLRRERSSTLGDLSEADQAMFRGAFTLNELDRLRSLINASLFSLVYPVALVRGVAEFTRHSLESQFKGVDITADAPYIVRDRLIYGELLSLIPLESDWCRGYMMLQTAEQPLVDFVRQDKTHIDSGATNFRDINNVLGELTNLVWGAFKNRYTSQEAFTGHLTQVPIIVNHAHRYISFGSDDPQLCFKYTLHDAEGDSPPLSIYQRFVFNLNWSPERFKENEALVNNLLGSGALELF